MPVEDILPSAPLDLITISKIRYNTTKLNSVTPLIMIEKKDSMRVLNHKCIAMSVSTQNGLYILAFDPAKREWTLLNESNSDPDTDYQKIKQQMNINQFQFVKNVYTITQNKKSAPEFVKTNNNMPA